MDLILNYMHLIIWANHNVYYKIHLSTDWMSRKYWSKAIRFVCEPYKNSSLLVRLFVYLPARLWWYMWLSFAVFNYSCLEGTHKHHNIRRITHIHVDMYMYITYKYIKYTYLADTFDSDSLLSLYQIDSVACRH